jgi:hypothetical protein
MKMLRVGRSGSRLCIAAALALVFKRLTSETPD